MLNPDRNIGQKKKLMKKVNITSDFIKSYISDDAFLKRGYFTDANDVSLKTGMYGVNFNHTAVANLPDRVTYGSMIVFNGSGLVDGNPIVNILFAGSGAIYIRHKWHILDFHPWKEI